MDLEKFILFANISTASTLVPISFGLTKFRLITLELRLVLGLLGMSFFCDLVEFPLHYWRINNYAGDLYRLTEFTLLLILYYKILGNPRMFKTYLILGLLYILFFVSNLLFLQQEKINSYTNTISALIFIVLAVGFFYKLMQDLPALQIYQLPMFWINVAILVYFSGNLFLFILSHYLVAIMKDNLMVYWSFHNGLSILKNILFTVGFYMVAKPFKNLL